MKTYSATAAIIPNNQELPLLAALFTSLLCVTFGANAVAIKVCYAGLGPFTSAGNTVFHGQHGNCGVGRVHGAVFQVQERTDPPTPDYLHDIYNPTVVSLLGIHQDRSFSGDPAD